MTSSTKLIGYLAAAVLMASASIAPAASLVVKFTTPPEVAKLATFTDVTVVAVGWKRTEKGHLESLGEPRETTKQATNFELTLKDLPAGKYQVVVFTGKDRDMVNANRPGAFNYVTGFNLDDEASSKSLDVAWKPLDTSTFQGKTTFAGKVVSTTNKPLAGKSLSAALAIREAGFYRVETTKSEADGTFRFQNLVAGSQYVLLTPEFDELALFVAQNNVQPEPVIVPPMKGDPAPDINFFPLADGPGTKLSSHRGKVVVLDFWATWCGPCQAPMAKMNTYREAHPEWAGKVELIALSVDDSRDKVAQHTQKRGWNRVTNMWIGESAPGSIPVQKMLFAVNGIPHMVVVDQQGNIAAVGHPSELDVPKIVAELLEKEKS